MRNSAHRLSAHRLSAHRLSASGMLGRTLLGGALAAAVVVALAGCGAGAGASQAAGAIGSVVKTSAPTTSASPTPKPTATPKPTPTAAPAPKITHATVTATVVIPFESSTTDDPDRAAGETAVVTAGANGTTTQTWDVTSTDGVETGRTLVSEKTTTEPVTEVTAVGSKQAAPAPAAAAAPASDCDPNYSGACVPIDSDVDCAGGSGNGPSYVRGPVQVVGDDIYGLDRDGDGVGCE